MRLSREVVAGEVVCQRRDVDRGKAEARDDDAGDETGLPGGKPLHRRGRCRGVPEADARAGEEAETDHIPEDRRRVGGDDAAHAGEDTARGSHPPWADPVLKTAGGNRHQREGDTGDRVGKRLVRIIPAPFGRDRFLDDAPRVEHPERKVDTHSCECNSPPLVLGNGTGHHRIRLSCC